MIRLLHHTRRPDISFSRDGTINITARIVRDLALRPGDAISVATQDGEYFLHAIRPLECVRLTARCYPTKKGSRNYRAKSVELCRALLQAAGIQADRAAFITGEKILHADLAYIPIITQMPII